MTARDFVYWLQGYLELENTGAGLTPLQKEIIKEHLKLVFDKQTPDFYPSIPINTPIVGPYKPYVNTPHTGDPLPSSYPTVFSGILAGMESKTLSDTTISC